MQRKMCHKTRGGNQEATAAFIATCYLSSFIFFFLIWNFFLGSGEAALDGWNQHTRLSIGAPTTFAASNSNGGRKVASHTAQQPTLSATRRAPRCGLLPQVGGDG